MSLQTTLSVNFGSRKRNLSTVGYTLYNQGKSIIQARTTTGVTQIAADTGIYQVFISLAEAFIGSIIWDTGEATKLYTVEDLDFRKFTFQSVIVGGRGGKSVWTEKEKKRILKNVRSILDIVKDMKIVDNSELLRAIGANIKEVSERSVVNYKFINESLGSISSDVKKKDNIYSKFINESLNLILSEVKKGDAIKTLQEGIDKLSEGLIAIIEHGEAERVVKEASKYVEG